MKHVILVRESRNDIISTQTDEIVQTTVVQIETTDTELVEAGTVPEATEEDAAVVTETVAYEPSCEPGTEEGPVFNSSLTETGIPDLKTPDRDLEMAADLDKIPRPEMKTEPAGDSETTTETQVEKSLSYPIYYRDSGIEITITKEWFVGAWCYIAHINMSDYARLKTGLGYGNYGTHETTLSFDSRNNCLLTINCDYAEGEGKGVIRNGVVYNNDGRRPQCAYSQNTGVLRETHELTLSELVDMGYTDTFDFGASDLVVNGVSVYGRKDGGKSAQRTLIGTTGVPGEIYLVVTEGRYQDGVSRGLQYYEAGDLLESLGCSYGVALDGGGSSAMIWRGQPLNTYTGRALTGFVYITKSQ